ncbi:DUF559 domain-containing protein [Actinomycetes bacterium KLBMP 9759]
MGTGTDLRVLLARQDGLVTAEQAARAGVSGRALRARVQRAGWRRLAPRVFLAPGHPITDAVRVRAAGLWVGEKGAVSGAAAGFWHGMCRRAPATVDVTVPRDVGLRGCIGIRVRRRDLDAADVVLRHGILVTGVPITTLEVARVLPDGSAFLDRALQRHVPFQQVYESYCRNMGAEGAARSAQLLIAAADRADSAAERLMKEVLRRAAVTGWVHSYSFGNWIVDFAFPASKVAVEVDGWAWHADVERFGADRRKGNALGAAGWELLRFTWHDLTGRPGAVVAQVRAALARAA